MEQNFQQKNYNQPISNSSISQKDSKKTVSTFVGIMIIIFAAVVFVGGSFAYQYFVMQRIKPVTCTEEVKICPNGSAVGRTSPNCEFAQCFTVADQNTDYIIKVKQPSIIINSDFKSIPESFICSSNKDCETKIRPDCLKCPLGTKLVAQWNCEPHYILDGGNSKGVCADTSPGYDEFIHGGCYSYTAFCILESNGYVIFTKDVSDKHYFDLWEKVFLETNNISEDYFRAHFGNFYFYQIDSLEGTTSRIFYNFYLDWVELKISDDFLIKEKINNVETELTDELISRNLKKYFEIKRKIKPAQKVISFQKALDVMKKNCHPNAYSEDKLNGFYEQKYVTINDVGDLILTGFAKGEDIKGDVKSIGVNLVDGGLLYCKDEYYLR